MNVDFSIKVLIVSLFLMDQLITDQAQISPVCKRHFSTAVWFYYHFPKIKKIKEQNSS